MANLKKNVIAALTIVGGLIAALLGTIPALGVEPTATVSGTVFEDTDRDGVHDADENGFGDLLLYVFDLSGSNYLGNVRTDASGAYTYQVTAGDHLVTIASTSWRDWRADMTPSNAPSIQPSWPVTPTDGHASAHLGLRPIVRSTDQPMTSIVGPSGITIESYNDVVTAEEIHERMLEGTLIGPEAAVTRITHDAGSSTSCATGATKDDGRWVTYSARCNISWMSWLTHGDRSLFHEYGHAWSLYHGHLTQQDTNFTRYLEIRGLLGDGRVDTSHAWSRREMIAEDYRQLFGSAVARAATQENRDIPDATAVPGLMEFLRDAFTGSGPANPTDEPDPTADPTTDPTPDETTDPVPDPVDTDAPDITILSPTDGSAVAGSVTIIVSASDAASTPDKLTVTVRLGAADTVVASWDPASGRFVASLNTKGMKGSQTLLVLGRDQAGNSTQAALEVVIGKGGGDSTGSRGRGKS